MAAEVLPSMPANNRSVEPRSHGSHILPHPSVYHNMLFPPEIYKVAKGSNTCEFTLAWTHGTISMGP
jgi:hypothetical protein